MTGASSSPTTLAAGGTDPEAYDRRRVRSARGVLRAFNEAGVIEAAEVHVATRLGTLTHEPDETVLLACALAARALRTGSVCVALASAHEDIPTAEAENLPWPEPSTWATRVAGSALAASGLIRLEGDLLYLDRAWQEETQVVDDLTRTRAGAAAVRDLEAVERHLVRFFPEPGDQREAARAALLHRTSVLTGGPGTGKTTTVARLLGVVLALAADAGSADRVRVALAAPTGKAAARLGQALAGAIAGKDFPAAQRAALHGLDAVTVHRLLGWRPDARTRFRHDRENPLPYDVVVVDECSMLSLTLTARLLEALRPTARLVLVGDADQLASVEAGAVLKDLVEGFSAGASSPVTRLTFSHRYGAEIGGLAQAIRAGDAEETLRILHDDSDVVRIVEPEELDAILRDQARAVHEAAHRGPQEAVDTFEKHRLLCAHRDGPYGAEEWNRRTDRLLAAALGRDHLDRWYVGRPVIVNSNDYGTRLFNGDTGVVVPASGTRPGVIRHRVAFDTGGGPDVPPRLVPTTRLADVSTAHALTVHRAQGSQFTDVTVLLPEEDSRLLSRELLYTAVTRAKGRVRVVGSEEAIRAAVERRAVRATGLASRLGGADQTGD